MSAKVKPHDGRDGTSSPKASDGGPGLQTIRPHNDNRKSVIAAEAAKQAAQAAEQKALRAETIREVKQLQLLANLSFEPAPQRWARDEGSILRNDESLPTSGLNANPDLVSHVVLLRRASMWADDCETEVHALQVTIMTQFMLAGLRVCELDTRADPTGYRYFGMYATVHTLLEEKRNVMSDNMLSWTGDTTAEIPTVTFVSPAERMILTQRIIERCVDFTRVSRNEAEGFKRNPSMFQRIGGFCRDKCGGKLKKDQVRVSEIIKDIYGLHCKRIRLQLLRMFAKELRLFCCRSCQNHKVYDDSPDDEEDDDDADDFKATPDGANLSKFGLYKAQKALHTHKPVPGEDGKGQLVRFSSTVNRQAQ
jgi:hypothetical protein